MVEKDSVAATGVDNPVDWAKEFETCPCGKPCGPTFRYFLCDEHARETPDVVLFRMGELLGTLLKFQNTAERLRMALKEILDARQ